MRYFILLSVAIMGAAASMDAYAQQRFFTLSGGSRGDTANAKHESQISELGSRADARDGCGASGKLYGKAADGTRHGQSNDAGCIDSLVLDNEGNATFTGDTIVSGDVLVDGKKVQPHALSENITCDDNEKLTWSGESWTCTQEADPKVGNLVSGKWCAESGGKIVCNQEKPSNDTELDVAFDDALASGVRDFARKGGALASCGGGELLTSDGSTLKCLSLDTIVAGTLLLDDLSDVSMGLPAFEDLLYFNGTNWTNGPVMEPFAKAEVDNLTGGRCQVGEIVTFDGDKLACVADIGGPGDSLILEDMADVSGTTSATATNILYFDGTYWKADAERDLTVSDWARIANPITNLLAGQCDAGFVLTFDGTQLTCVADAGGVGAPTVLSDNTDVSITAPVNNQVLAYQGGTWVNQTETDPNIQAFARNANPLPTCAANNILTANGTALSCVADAGSAANGISIDDLTDVSITALANHEILVSNGAGFINKTGTVCGAGEVTRYDGTDFLCESVTDLGLWSDNTTYITRGSAHVINNAQALPGALTGAGTRTLWYPNKAAFRAGEVTGTQWDDGSIGNHSFAVGLDATASGARSVALGGSDATASGDDSVAIGLGTTAFDVTNNNTMAIMGGQVGIDTVNPNAALEVSGTIIISDGGETCDAAHEGGIRYAGGNIEICDGAAWGGVTAGATDYYNITSLPVGVQNISNTELTNVELGELQNIDAVTISNTQWGYLGAMDQSLTTTDNVTFVDITASDDAVITDHLTVADVSVTDDLTVGDDFNVIGATDLNTLVTSGDGTIGGTLTVLGSLNVSGTQTIDGVVFAGGGIDASGHISATTFSGDGSALTGVTASGVDYYDITSLPVGVQNISNTELTTGELGELQNINAVTISNTQWGYLGAADQAIATTDNVTFADITASDDAVITDHLTVADVSVTDDLDVTDDLNVGGDTVVTGDVTMANANVGADLDVTGRVDVTTDVSVTGDVQANAFIGDGSGLTGVTAGSADYYDLTSLPVGVQNISNTELTTGELGELQNINAVTISNTQWGYLGAADQAIATTDNVTFADITASDDAVITDHLTVADVSVTDDLDVTDDFSVGGDGTIAGTLTVLGALNVSGTQTIDGVVFAGGGIDATGNISATTFTGDGSALTNVTASGVDYYDITSLPVGVQNISNTELTTGELGELQNINAVTISNTQWGYLGAMDQSLTTTDNVTFADITASDDAVITDHLTVADASVTDDLTVGDDFNVIGATDLNTLVTSGDGTIGGTLTVLGSLNVSGTQTIDGVVFAGGGIDATGNISATTFSGDGSALTNVTASGVDYYDITSLPVGVQNISNTELTTGELGELQNINAVTISNTQWGYLGAADQAIATTDNVTFADITASDDAVITDHLTVADVSVTDDLTVGDDFNVIGATDLNTLVTSGDGTIGGTLTVLGSLNVSGTQSIDGVVFAGGGIDATGNISATTFAGDGSALTNLDVSSMAIGIDDLSDAIHDTDDYSSLFLGNGAGANDDGTSNLNIGIGRDALSSVITGPNNTAIGVDALNAATGSGNIAVGNVALEDNTGNSNTAVGFGAMTDLGFSSNNVALGNLAGAGSDGASSSVDNNVFIGASSGNAVLSGADDNTFVGYQAGDTVTTGARNILIGSGTDTTAVGADDELNIGNTIFGDLANDKIAIGANVSSVDATTHATVDVSGTLKIAGTGAEACDANNTGVIRFNPATGRLQYCRP